MPILIIGRLLNKPAFFRIAAPSKAALITLCKVQPSLRG